nr:unnamed protein product [Digitaria exilis]
MHAQRLHVVAERAGVPEPVRPEHLVVGEVERAAHALLAAVPGVVLVPCVTKGRRHPRTPASSSPALANASFLAAARTTCSTSARRRRSAPDPGLRSIASYLSVMLPSRPTISTQ